MKLENQVCTLEQGKRLKELGVEQNSFLYWHEDENIEGTFWDVAQMVCPTDGNYSAFTVSELQIMDGSLGNIDISIRTGHKGKFYSTTNVSAEDWDNRFTYYNTLAEAWGDKLIRGIENGYYELSEINQRVKE